MLPEAVTLNTSRGSIRPPLANPMSASEQWHLHLLSAKLEAVGRTR